MNAVDFLDAPDTQKASDFLDAPDSITPTADTSKLDLNRIGEQDRLAREYTASMKAGDFTAAMANPRAGILPAGSKYLADVARSIPADIAAGFRADPSVSGNIPAAVMGKPLPIDEQLALASQESPAAATLGKVGQGLAGTAPMLAVGALPAWAGKLAALGFSAQMIKSGGESAKALGTEMGKNPEDRDMNVITSSLADLSTDVAFAPLAAKYGAVDSVEGYLRPNDLVIRKLGEQLKNAPLGGVPASSAPIAPASENRFSLPAEQTSKLDALKIAPEPPKAGSELPAEPQPTLNIPEIEKEIAKRLKEGGQVASGDFTIEGIKKALGLPEELQGDTTRIAPMIDAGLIERTDEDNYRFNQNIQQLGTLKNITSPEAAGRATTSDIVPSATLSRPEPKNVPTGVLEGNKGVPVEPSNAKDAYDDWQLAVENFKRAEKTGDESQIRYWSKAESNAKDAWTRAATVPENPVVKESLTTPKSELPEGAQFLKPETISKNGMIYVARNPDGSINVKKSGKLYQRKGSQYYVGGEDNIKAHSLIDFKFGKAAAMSEEDFNRIIAKSSEKPLDIAINPNLERTVKFKDKAQLLDDLKALDNPTPEQASKRDALQAESDSVKAKMQAEFQKVKAQPNATNLEEISSRVRNLYTSGIGKEKLKADFGVNDAQLDDILSGKYIKRISAEEAVALQPKAIPSETVAEMEARKQAYKANLNPPQPLTSETPAKPLEAATEADWQSTIKSSQLSENQKIQLVRDVDGALRANWDSEDFLKLWKSPKGRKPHVGERLWNSVVSQIHEQLFGKGAAKPTDTPTTATAKVAEHIADVKAAEENPFDSISTSRKLTELQKSKPRPVEKMYGPNPTPEQRASQEALIRKWNSERAKALKAHKAEVEKSNEWIAANKQTDEPTQHADPSEPAKPRLGKGGPGAAEGGEPGTYSPIQHMADRLRTQTAPSAPIDSQLRMIDRVRMVGADAKDAVKRSLARLQAVKDAVWEKWKGLPEYGDEQRAVGKWFYALQKADAEARNFAKAIVKEVPSKLRREAITNYIQAEGDVSVLKERADESTGSIKQGYEIAQNLTPREVEIAGMLRDYYDIQLQQGIESGILKDGLENYITQVWKKENPITKKLISDLSFGKLQPNFKYAKKRLFDSYFEGEQAGYVPNKDAGFLVANYDQSFNKSLAARAFIKDLHEGKASDGRPLVEISGNGKVVEGDNTGSSVLVNPHAQPEELSDYRTIDHPALRGWKWATKTPEGKNVFVKGDMLVHPEAYAKLKNRLSVSAFRQNPVARTLLEVQSGIKQTMLSVSGFHQTQETLHALGHRVNPIGMPEIDFSEPVTKSLVEHGLQLADYNALADFGEGLSGGGLTAKVPIVGAKLHAYNEWLFQDYIPRLKLTMAKAALERNREIYPTLSEDKLLEQTAKQANAAFGELPYKYWGRSPTLQDALRAFLLAPDFLEARARFVGRALRPYGREQLVAIGLLAATQYITARIMNQILDDDPHWELKNAFRIVAKGHAYGLRTIPADLIHLFSDTRGFFYNRMSPSLRVATEYITGRDDKGVKKDLMEQAKDALKMPIPISMKSRLGQKWWEGFLNSFGVQNQRYDAVQTIQQKASDFKKKLGVVNPNETLYNIEQDKYAALRMALQDGSRKEAQAQFNKLKATTPPAKIYEHFKDSLSRPLTGSKANDAKFLASLDALGRQEYKEAKDLQQARLQMVLSLR